MVSQRRKDAKKTIRTSISVRIADLEGNPPVKKIRLAFGDSDVLPWLSDERFGHYLPASSSPPWSCNRPRFRAKVKGFLCAFAPGERLVFDAAGFALGPIMSSCG